MFAHDPLRPTSTNPSTRNPRRRQRNSADENGLALPSAKKRRSVLAGSTFIRPDDVHHHHQPHPSIEADGELHANGGPVMNGSIVKEHRTLSSEGRELVVRDKRRSSHRGIKGDGSVILTKNESFTVSKLVALPDNLRNLGDEAYAGVFSDTAYALALTASQAIVWPYLAILSSPETFIFSLPPAPKGNADLLPLGALATPSDASAEPGLVVVMPATGKITYWASITSAASLDLTRQQRSGLEGSVGSMFSGELIVQIVDVAPAGFVLGFSSGRLALLTLRDTQGRPAVRVQIMRSQVAGGGGLFGGLKQVLVGGSWPKDVVAVRAASRRKREERDVAVITAKGVVQIWTVHRGGHHHLRQESRAGADMVAAIKQAVPDLERYSDDKFETLDFAFIPGFDNIDETNVEGGGATSRKLLVLGTFHEAKAATYLLLELIIASTTVQVGFVHPLRSYTTPLSTRVRKRPRLVLPSPPRAAFVIFDRAVVVTSLAKGVDSPSQQLLADVHRFPKAFEEVLDFQEGLDIEVVGCGSEDGSEGRSFSSGHDSHHRRRSPHPACVLLLRTVGVVRISIPPPSHHGSLAESESLPIKSRIEQAISYGEQPHNPLYFGARPELQPAPEEIEEATLSISSEILTSTSKAVISLAPSLEHQLNHRLTVHQALASYINSVFPPLPRPAKWRLLFDGERLAAAIDVWKHYDHRPKGSDAQSSSPVLLTLAERMQDHEVDAGRSLPMIDEKKGEPDQVRHMFIRGIRKLETIIAGTRVVVLDHHHDHQKSLAQELDLLSQAYDIFLTGLTAAFDYRQREAARYGLQEEGMIDGLLKSPHTHYDGLPEFWTSNAYIVQAGQELADLSYALLAQCSPTPKLPSGRGATLVKTLRHRFPDLAHMHCRITLERSRWFSGQTNPPRQADGAACKQEHIRIRRELCGQLRDLGLIDEAMSLADRFAEVDGLMDLVMEELATIDESRQQRGVTPEERTRLDQRKKELEERFMQHFHKFGSRWARALFERNIQQGRLASLLDQRVEFRPLLTRFLRTHPGYAKVSWINEVLREENVRQAANILQTDAARFERDLWSKKVELSLSKLSILAAEAEAEDDEGASGETTGVNGTNGVHSDDATTKLDDNERISELDRDLQLIEVQEQLYQHVQPSIREAIDEAAAVDLVIKDYGRKLTHGKPALRTVLEQGLRSLVAREPLNFEMTIQVLTLIDHRDDITTASELTGHEFALALRINRLLRAVATEKATLLERIIWRRCLIRDDWVTINDTPRKDDEAMTELTANTALFRTVQDLSSQVTGFQQDSTDTEPRAPHEVLGAGSTVPELRLLFPEDLCAPIAADLRKEDARLQKQMDRGRLEEWFSGTVEAARTSVQTDASSEARLALRRRMLAANLRENAR
ncbi:MAG: electron carrier [Watsoniomyces obsoletus]|nr:MAG: electron carrier [Watsoniomyces obsoletus]